MSEKIRVLETESEFLSIRLRHDFKVLRSWAEWCIKEHGCDFERIAKKGVSEWKAFDECIVGGFWDYQKCSILYASWDYAKMDPIYLSPEYFLGDGHHRGLVLACLLIQGKVAYQPVPFFYDVAARGHEHVFGCKPKKDHGEAVFKEAIRRRERWIQLPEDEKMRRLEEMDAVAAAVDMEADVFQPFA